MHSSAKILNQWWCNRCGSRSGVGGGMGLDRSNPISVSTDTPPTYGAGDSHLRRPRAGLGAENHHRPCRRQTQ